MADTNIGRKKPRSKRIAHLPEHQRMDFLLAWIRRARHRGVTFERFAQKMPAWVKKSKNWYHDLDSLWNSVPGK